jgi:hypothetical protein
MLDDAGIEYITGLFLIFHPWPDKIEYDTSSIKVSLTDSFFQQLWNGKDF